MGESGGSGFFIATCRSPIDNNWYQYNDDLVFPVTDFNQQILNYAMSAVIRSNHFLFFPSFNQVIEESSVPPKLTEPSYV